MKKVKKLEEALEQIPIVDVIDEFNIEIDFKGRCSCLIHDETKPSMFIDLTNNRWHCFSCQHGGGVASLIADFYQIHQNAKNYYDSLKLYLTKHPYLINELGFADLLNRDFQPTPSTLTEVSSILDRVENREKPSLIPIKLKPSKNANINDIINFFIYIQNRR